MVQVIDGSDNGLALDRQQAIILTNDSHIYMHHSAYRN